MVRLIINGQEVGVEEGKTILEAAQSIGIDIPTLCYHPTLSPYGACRLCVVEIENNGRTTLQASCQYKVQEGINVQTHSERVVKGRKMMAELHLARCPDSEEVIKIANSLGVTDTRLEKKNEDCTLCGLCVRICHERMGIGAIDFVNRGINREIKPPFDTYSATCRACGACVYICPAGVRGPKLEEVSESKPIPIPSEFDEGLISRTAIYTPFPQAVPKIPVIDRESCMHFITGGCKVCEEVCEAKAIKYTQEDENIELNVGAIILATGIDNYDVRKVENYAYGMSENIYSAIEFERILNASGPTGGNINLRSQGAFTDKQPKTVGIVHCVGSRDKNHNEYCSRVCCMYSLKFAHLVKERLPDSNVINFYIDMRTFGKGYEEFYMRLLEEDVIFIRGKVVDVDVDKAGTSDEQITIKVNDSLLGKTLKILLDMLVLSPALVAKPDSREVGNLFGVGCTTAGFFQERHPKMAPVNAMVDGVFLAGACQGPKDIPDSVAQGGAAAGGALALIHSGFVVEPITSTVDDTKCSACKTCISLCPYTAINFDEEKNASVITEEKCHGCGICVSVCPSSAISQKYYSDEAILAEIRGALLQEILQEVRK